MQGRVLRQAACLHATSDQEYNEIRLAGLENPVSVIPNGIDVPKLDSPLDFDRCGRRRVLSLGRIHPKKGLDRLLCAWALVEAEFPDWELKIVGPVEGDHDKELSRLRTELGLCRVAIDGPIYGSAKFALYAGSDLFVLPTLNENFGLTVAEALACGVPVITTKGAPWQGLNSEGCGWWVDHPAEAIAAALAEAMTMPQTALQAMGRSGRTWMERDFSWTPIAREMLAVYQWLTYGGERPRTVRLA
jgi:glycosyltransferase involved in cell wall biosynthesis